MLLFVFDYHWFDISWIVAMAYAAIEVLGYMLIFYVNYYMLKKRSQQNWLYSILYSVLLITAYILIIRLSGLELFLYEAGGLRNLFSLLLNAGLFTKNTYSYVYVKSDELFTKDTFIRIHHSYIVNKHCIQQIEGGQMLIANAKLPISRANRKIVNEWLKNGR